MRAEPFIGGPYEENRNRTSKGDKGAALSWWADLSQRDIEKPFVLADQKQAV